VTSSCGVTGTCLMLSSLRSCAAISAIVVPDAAALTAEVAVENQDIGFVHEGQAAQVKLETFSFTRYGTLPARVRTVSADAVVDDKRGVVFAVTLTLDRDAIEVDGRTVRLAPGMNLTAEVRIGRRRVIDYWLGPLQRRTSEALRER
jgi:hemolysin D